MLRTQIINRLRDLCSLRYMWIPADKYFPLSAVTVRSLILADAIRRRFYLCLFVACRRNRVSMELVRS